MAPVADNLGLEVGKLLGEMIVEGLGLVELVEGVEILALAFQILGGLNEEETAIPDVIGIQRLLRP
jgi:hypothetical protein